MKLLKNIFLCSFILSVFVIQGGMCDLPCINKIGNDTVNFINKVKTLVGTDNSLNQSFVDGHKREFYELISDNVALHCTNRKDINAIADTESIVIPFTIDSRRYDITINTAGLFDYFERGAFTFLVMKDRNKKPGDIVTKSSMPTDYFFSNECSDHHVRFNLSNKAAVNRAGQTAFASYGGSENEFFLDMPVEKSCRAFPGMVLGDFGGWGAKEKIVVYTNYREARKALKNFANALQNTTCGNQGLAVYQVAIKDIPEDKGTNRGWMLIVSGVFAASAFVPQDLADIQQVTILSEPEIIR